MVRSRERLSGFSSSSPSIFDPGQSATINFGGPLASLQRSQDAAMNDHQPDKEKHRCRKPVNGKRAALADDPAQNQNSHKHDNPGIPRPDVFAMQNAGLC